LSQDLGGGVPSLPYYYLKLGVSVQAPLKENMPVAAIPNIVIFTNVTAFPVEDYLLISTVFHEFKPI